MEGGAVCRGEEVIREQMFRRCAAATTEPAGRGRVHLGALISFCYKHIFVYVFMGVMFSFSALQTSSPSYNPIFRAPLVIDATTHRLSSMLVTVRMTS